MPFVTAFLVVPDVIMRAMFARGAFTKGDAAAAGATLAAYAIGLIPFVLIRSAVATFYARKDTATPVKAALTGVAVNVGLKIALVGSLAQVGLAFATAVGAWINLLLVTAFAVRAGYLHLDRTLIAIAGKVCRCRSPPGRGPLADGEALGHVSFDSQRLPRRGCLRLADHRRRAGLCGIGAAAIRSGLAEIVGARLGRVLPSA